MQEQNRDTARKLFVATMCMFTLPLMIFYIGNYFVFAHHDDPMMYSGFAAVGMANVVIFGYVWSAFSEPEEMDETDKRLGTSTTTGKDQDNDASRPRVGAFKQRTD